MKTKAAKSSKQRHLFLLYKSMLFSVIDCGLGPVSWRPMTVKWRQSSQPNRNSTIGTRQTEYHEALPASANDEVRCDYTFADDGNASWYSVCRLPMVEWRLDCEDCRHLTVVGLHNTDPGVTILSHFSLLKLDRMQNEAMSFIPETAKDTSIYAMRYLLDLPSMEARHKVEQVTAYLSARKNPMKPLHEAVK